MNVRIGHFCLVSDFLDIGFNSRDISDSITTGIFKILKENNLTIADDWSLIFDATYNNGTVPLVAKNRLGSYPSDKMKYIKIVILVPLKYERDWGVNPEQHLYKKDHYSKLMKNFRELAVDFRDYTNRKDYISVCLKAGIKKAFEEGFTVGKTAIKVKKPVGL